MRICTNLFYLSKTYSISDRCSSFTHEIPKQPKTGHIIMQNPISRFMFNAWGIHVYIDNVWVDIGQ